MGMQNFIEDYLTFSKGTEVPVIYDRWSAISGIGAILGRNVWVTHGRSRIFPNQYIMLVGDSGARKDTAIRAIPKLLKDAGYHKMVADKLSKEKFLMDMEEGLDKVSDPNNKFDVFKDTKNPTMQALFGGDLNDDPSECYISIGEFNAFLGHGNIEFIDLFTNLWDYDGVYESRIKNGKSVRIPYPTISILGGNTSVGISMAFPTEVIGQGFFSRLIMVYSDPTGLKITRPPLADQKLRAELVKQLKAMKEMKGEIKITDTAWDAIDAIYQDWEGLEDVRFKSYSSRRFTHLLKMCLSCACAKLEKEIGVDTVEYANSILRYTEHFMPKALGEFGKARNSDVSAKILTLLETNNDKPMHPIKDIWPQVRRDLESQKQLMDILGGLQGADKIQVTPGGILQKKKPPKFDYPHCNVGMLREYAQKQFENGMPI